MLKDDKGAFPPYDACYVVRQDLLQQRPEVDRALRALEGRINDGTMRGLNRLVDIEHQPVAKVARDFLTTLP
jgi:glycine betaine/choline ABC-type transport system substrate-binding protein